MKKLLLSLFILFSFYTPAICDVSIQPYTENVGLIDDYIDMARLYTSNAEYEKALEYIETINKLSPNNPKILYEKAIILKNYNQPILARNLMQEVAQLDPSYKETYLYKEFFKEDLPGFYLPKNYDSEYYKKKGEDAYNECKYEKALDYFRKASQLKKTVENYNNLGKAFIKTNHPKKALKSFEEAINLDVKNPQTYINLAMYYCEIEHNSRKQMKYLKEAIKINPDLAEPYYQMGNIYFEKGQYETAVEYYRLAIAKDDTLYDAYYALGSTLFKINDFEETYFVFEKSLLLELDNPKVYDYLAKTSIELRHFDEAQNYIERAISIEPTPDNYLLLSKILYLRGFYDKSINILNTKIADKNNAEMYNYLGLNFFQKSEFTTALNYFNKAIMLKEKPSYYYNIAVCYNIMNNKEKMKEFSNKAINTLPKNAQDYIDIANIYLDLNNENEAISTLTKGILTYPNERKLYNKKLEILQKTGKTKEYNKTQIQINTNFQKETVYMGK